MPFFIGIAAVLAVLSLVLFVPVFGAYLQTGLVLRFPTLIVSGFLMLGALLSVAAGAILDTVIKKDRQAFELRLNMIKMLERLKK